MFTSDGDSLCRSPESLRDVRGFSVKFYTEEGNWDFVGNDIPVRCLLSSLLQPQPFQGLYFVGNVNLCLLTCQTMLFSGP